MTRGVYWFRNDLRLRDNVALDSLARRVERWIPIFILDPRIAGAEGEGTPRLRFLLDCLDRLGGALEKRGIPLLVRSGRPEEILPRLLHETGAELLAFNEDTTPFACHRDLAVRRAVEKQGIEVLTRVDHVIFRGSDIQTAKGEPYSVYSPYRKSWWRRFEEDPQLPIRMRRLPPPIPGFVADRVFDRSGANDEVAGCKVPTGGEDAAKRRLEHFLETRVGRYDEDRDRPDIDGTSRLSSYLRFGALSVRECFHRARQAAVAEPPLWRGVRKWLDELVWREFYAAILEQHPRVLNENYRKEYDTLVWNEDSDAFDAWCEGRTGFPIVDAGMRQLRAEGWMHNRVRMIVSSFLTKDLLIHWKHGEQFFFKHLVDGDLASNNGGWQWAASTGTDSQPYFRIFNPLAQAKRWDPEGRYVQRWVPELRALSGSGVHEPCGSAVSVDYPIPIVDHAERRKLALERFRGARAARGRS